MSAIDQVGIQIRNYGIVGNTSQSGRSHRCSEVARTKCLGSASDVNGIGEYRPRHEGVRVELVQQLASHLDAYYIRSGQLNTVVEVHTHIANVTITPLYPEQSRAVLRSNRKAGSTA